MKPFCRKMEPIFTQNAQSGCLLVTDFDGIAISGSEGKRIFGGRAACGIIKAFDLFYKKTEVLHRSTSAFL